VSDVTTSVLVDRVGRVARITIDRPPVNVLDTSTIETLSDRLSEIGADGDCALVELRGAGSRAFSAGVEVRDHAPARAPDMLSRFHALCRTVLALPQTTVAAVRGYCLGGGCELASCCDFVIAEHTASFGQPEINVGCFPPVAALLLPRLVGARRAFEMILTGDSINGRRAAEIGLITRSVSPALFERELEGLERTLLSKSGVALAAARRAVRIGYVPEFEAHLAAVEELYCRDLLRTLDAAEGVNAFVEKRAPLWEHR
jgi:cyclohexa-1,5-dienecarbonyl-CoA hydratase